MTPITSLEQAAQALEAARLADAAAVRRWKELCPAYDAAREHMRETQQEVERIEHGMAYAKRAYAVAQALNESGLEYDGPPVILVGSWVSTTPQPWFLAAVGKGGSGLYLFTPERSHRYQSKEYALRIVDAQRHGIEEEPDRRVDSAYGTPQHEREAGLWNWWIKGVGDFGRGSGATKPVPPPEGGRWKWLKIREQEALPA